MSIIVIPKKGNLYGTYLHTAGAKECIDRYVKNVWMSFDISINSIKSKMNNQMTVGHIIR